MTLDIQKEIEIFCQNLKLLRESKHLSKKEMSKKLKISMTALTSIENGILPPKLSTSLLINIYQEFGVHPKDMFTPNK
jgi:transcriptional regulator with XRE-family HTH domain